MRGWSGRDTFPKVYQGGVSNPVANPPYGSTSRRRIEAGPFWPRWKIRKAVERVGESGAAEAIEADAVCFLRCNQIIGVDPCYSDDGLSSPVWPCAKASPGRCRGVDIRTSRFNVCSGSPLDIDVATRSPSGGLPPFAASSPCSRRGRTRILHVVVVIVIDVQRQRVASNARENLVLAIWTRQRGVGYP